jgi:hypothetical protein
MGRNKWDNRFKFTKKSLKKPLKFLRRKLKILELHQNIISPHVKPPK